MYKPMYKPMVSIIIPVYNGERYLGDAIRSALAQTYERIEVIVVNDGSTDDGATERVARTFGTSIRYIEKTNGGSSSALNCGARAMKGDLFSWLSHDDLYHPNKISRQIELLDNLRRTNPSVEIARHVVTAPSEIISSTGAVLRRPDKAAIDRQRKLIAKIGSVDLVLESVGRLQFHGCSYLLPKTCFDDVGPFDESLTLTNDIDYWFRLLSSGYILNVVPEVLVMGRIHSGQVSQNFRLMAANSEHERFWYSVIQWLMTDDSGAQPVHFLRAGAKALRAGQPRAADVAFAAVEGPLIAAVPLARTSSIARRHVGNAIRSVYYHVRAS